MPRKTKTAPRKSGMEQPTPITNWKNRHYLSIPASKMFIDTSFQREVSVNKVKDIVANFDEGAIRTLVVSARGKNGSVKYSVIDGQNRMTACKELLGENIELPCEVHTGLTYAQEAALFTKLNHSTPVNANQKFRANLAAGMPEETDIAAIVKGLGMTLMFDKTPQKYGLRAPGQLRRLYVAFGSEVFKRGMIILTKAFLTNQYKAEALKPDLISGLMHFINICELTDHQIISKLKAHTPQAINYAVAQRLIGKPRWRSPDVYMEILAAACDIKLKRKSSKRV